MLDRLFITEVGSYTLMTGTYVPWLVLVSIFLAMMASFFALRLAAAARHIVTPSHKQVALISGAFIMAGGIWSMHFVGMLAFQMPHHMSYDTLLTLISLLPAVLASYLVLRSLINQRDSYRLILRNGVVVGAGIGAMHYIGMEAMEMGAMLRYDPYWFGLSIVVAVGLAIVALSARRLLKHHFPTMRSFHINLVSAAIMGCAISGMHYTGMEAARFIMLEPHSMMMAPQDLHEQSFIAIAVSIATLLISTLAVNVSSQLRYRQLLTEKTASESRLQAILDTATDGVITIDAKGVIQGVNFAASRIFGWQEHELLGQNISKLMPAPHKQAHDGYLANYLRTGENKIIGAPREVYAQHKKGHEFPVRLGVGKVHLAHGDTLFVGFIADISERKAMEVKLRDSQERLTSLMRNIPGAAFRRCFDPKWSPIFLSDAIVELCGYRSEEFLQGNISLASLIVEEDEQSVRDTIAALPSDKQTYAVEYQLIDKAGQPVWVLENGMVVRDEDGTILWIDGVMINITNRKEMESELLNAKRIAEEAVETKAAFLANMSHEIRTPMNAIIGFTNILLESPMGSEDRRHLETISNASRSLLHLLNDILDSAKLEKSKLEVEPVVFHLADCVDGVISTLWLNAKNKGIELNLHIDDRVPAIVFGAEDRIRQVLMNLVGNGIKFTEEGSVTLNIAPTEQIDVMRFSVIDTGIGIAPDRVDAIFDPFTQADASMSRRFGGTGLGTSISKQLVELMGGEIHATSELGKGSCFYFELPLPKSERLPRADVHSQVKLPSQRVLVCDDIEQNVTLLSLLLERAGHQVWVARDGVEAVQQYQTHEIDLILMDLQMPRLDGLQASRQIRQWEREQDKPPVAIIALTASVLTEDKRQAQEAGMNGFANKPVDFNRLSAEMARVLKVESQVSIPSSPAEPSGKESRDQAMIHWQKALTLWVDEALYLAELGKMLDKHEGLPSALAQSLQNQDWRAVRSQAHALKGVCGNLALMALHQLFAQIEHAAIQQDHAKALPLIGDLSLCWHKVKQELDSRIALSQTDTQVKEITLDDALPADEIERLLTEWRAATHSGELREDIGETLRSRAPDKLQKPIIDAMNAIDEFEFSKASEHIDLALTYLAE